MRCYQLHVWANDRNGLLVFTGRAASHEEREFHWQLPVGLLETVRRTMRADDTAYIRERDGIPQSIAVESLEGETVCVLTSVGAIDTQVLCDGMPDIELATACRGHLRAALKRWDINETTAKLLGVICRAAMMSRVEIHAPESDESPVTIDAGGWTLLVAAHEDDPCEAAPAEPKKRHGATMDVRQTTIGGVE